MGLLQSYVHKGGELHLFSQAEPAGVAGGADAAQRVAAPDSGGGSLQIAGLRVEPEGDTLMITGRVSGPNIAYLYTELLLKDPHLDRYYGPVLREYVRADRSDGSSGITRPDWGETVDLRVKMRPFLRLATDGAHLAFCFALPEAYLTSGYRQGGLYQSAGQAEPLRALLGFTSDGGLKRAITYTEQAKLSGPKVVTPGHGDRFTPFAQVFTPSTTASGWEITPAVADTLELGSYPLRVVVDRLFPGDYVVGLLAQDLDGGIFRDYVPLRLSG